MQDLKVEIVLRKKDIEAIPKDIQDIIDQHRTFEGDSKIVMNVPTDWAGLRDGTLSDMFSLFGEAIYVALAYFTMDGREIVTDFNGAPAERYESVLSGKRVFKYVKKRLRIVTIFDEEKEIFEIKGFILDFENKVVKVLDLYNYGAESGIPLSLFVER